MGDMAFSRAVGVRTVQLEMTMAIVIGGRFHEDEHVYLHGHGDCGFRLLRLLACGFSLHNIKLPPGFSISLYATYVTNARGMALGKNGTLFVGSKTEGRVYAIVDENGDHR